MPMQKGRLEAFSDGVIAIILTIMVLEMKVPHGDNLDSLKPLLPVFISYVLSFIYIGIYWNNHHHMLHISKQISGKVLWRNFHLLFWLSLVPFVTGWMGENHFTALPVALYGFVMLMASIAYYLLSQSLIHVNGKDSDLAHSIGRDKKGKISTGIYILGIILCYFNPWLSMACYVIVAGIWFIPDQRIEKHLQH